MKKFLFILCIAFSVQLICSEAQANNNEVLYAYNTVSRSTTRLYWSNECLTLYNNGNCVLTQGDSVRIEGTYVIKDGWVILYFGNGSVSCKATIGKDGSVSSVSYNGNVYRKR